MNSRRLMMGTVWTVGALLTACGHPPPLPKTTTATASTEAIAPPAPAPPPAPATQPIRMAAQEAFSRVNVPSLETDRAGQAVVLLGHWSPAPEPAGSGPAWPSGRGGVERPGHRGAVLLLHGCGGPYEAGGRLSERMREYTAVLHAQGWSVLVLDSLTTRGERELCTQRIGQRRITQANRRLDAWGALKWMATQPGIDARKLGLIGWSNGGSTVLSALQADRFEPRAAEVPRPAFAVAYYPGCVETARAGRASAPAAPLLLQVGREDDWTPAQPCIDWVQDLQNSGHRRADQLSIAVYPQAYHGFDGTAPLRLRTDVPNGVRPGSGVHVGGHPPSREASFIALQEWMVQTSKLTP